MGRELARMGAPFRQPEWSALALLEGPEYVRKVHDAYIKSGSEVISTNTFAVVPFHIGEDLFRERGEELAALAGRLAREAADAAPPREGGATGSRVLVAGSLPPPFGAYRPDLFLASDAAKVIGPIARGLAPSVDVWLAETLSSVAEARSIKQAVEQLPPHPFWVSFTIEDAPSPDGSAPPPRLRSGELVAEAAVAIVKELGAEAVLFNCSQPEVIGAAISTALEALRQAGFESVPVGAYANAFPPQTADATANAGLDPLRPDLDPPGYLTWVLDWTNRGATLVGGCCGIGPGHIATIRDGLAAKQA